MLNLLQRFEISFARRRRPDPGERWCAARFKGKRDASPQPGNSAPLIVIESVEDLFFYSLLGEIVSALRAVREVRVGRWASRSLNRYAWLSWRGFIGGRLDRWIFSRIRWKNIYDSLCDEAGDRADYVRAPWRELAYWAHAWSLFRGLKSKDYLAELRVRGVLIGDLVIDTYLRFRPAVELNLRDWYLFAVLRQAIKDIDTTTRYFIKANPSIYLTTYTTYIQHGVPARVAVAQGIPVWSFANAQQFSTQLTPAHLFQTKPCSTYREEFDQLQDQEKKLALASEMLGRRVSGVADTATANQCSAYETRTGNVPDVRGAAVIFLHDFYDSPHIYQRMVFHDFWEWACFTIETLQAGGLPFFLKPHPNQREESGQVLGKLREKYADLNFISPEVSNRQLVDAGLACAVTVYGSVAAEMAYLGVPSISCSISPQASFDAFPIATSRESYRTLLKNFQSMTLNTALMKNQACALYYMHNLNLSQDERDLRDGLIALYLDLIDLEGEKKAFDSKKIERLLDKLKNASAFHDFVNGLAAHL